MVPHLALAVERCSTEADRSQALLRDAGLTVAPIPTRANDPEVAEILAAVATNVA